jgi:hypothetical protein
MKGEFDIEDFYRLLIDAQADFLQKQAAEAAEIAKQAAEAASGAQEAPAPNRQRRSKKGQDPSTPGQGPPKKRKSGKLSGTFLQEIIDTWPQWATSYIREITEQRASQRVEGQFGSLKRTLGHRIERFQVVGNAVRLMGETSFRTSQNSMHKLKLPAALMSFLDQLCVGRVGLEKIWIAVVDLRKAESPLGPPTEDCCLVRQLYPGFPCPHVLNEKSRGNIQRFLADTAPESGPLLRLNDVPCRWWRVCTPSVAVKHSFDQLPVADEAEDTSDLASMHAFLERCHGYADASEENRRIIRQFWARLEPPERARKPAPRRSVGLADPPSLNIPGQQCVKPSGHSPLTPPQLRT